MTVGFQSSNYSSPGVSFGKGTKNWLKSSPKAAASIRSLHGLPSDEAVRQVIKAQTKRNKLSPEKAAQKLNSKVSSDSLKDDITGQGGTPNRFDRTA